jgi:neutral ceramidase
VRLSGYGSRTTEHEGVLQRIHAKALALQWSDEAPVVMVTVDNCGVPGALRTEVLARLAKAGHPIAEERLALHSSHTHCAPMLRGVLGMLFGADLTPEHQAHVDQYTEDLTAKVVTVVTQALDSMAPATADWGRAM